MNILFLVNELLYVCGVSKHFYHLIEGLQRKYPKNNFYVICGGGNAIESFKALGIPIIIKPNIRHESRSIMGYVKAIKEIHSFINKYDINIIHSHHHYSASISYRSTRLAKIPTILTNHGILPEVGTLNHFAADYIIALNEHIRDYLINNKIKDGKSVRIIRHGFPLINQSKKRNDKLKVLSGGRFVKDKGFDKYIRAVGNLPKTISTRAKFYLVGEGPEKSNLVKLNDYLGANIIFLDPIKDFQAELWETDIFVMPTVSTSEGFPTVLIEAGIAKNLIISSDFFGSEYILNEKNAIIYMSSDESALKDRLITAIANYKDYEILVTNFHQMISKIFDRNKMIIETMNFYKELSR